VIYVYPVSGPDHLQLRVGSGGLGVIAARRLDRRSPRVLPDASSRGGWGSGDRASPPSGATPGESPGTQPKPLRSPRCWLGRVRPET